MDANTVFIIAVATTRMILPGMPDMANMPGMADMTKPQRTLTMDLTSTRATTTSSKAECAIPAGLKLGPKVDLKIDLPEKPTTKPGADEGAATNRQNMVMKYYWMCGEVVPPGQPRILDSSKMMGSAGAQMTPDQIDRMSRGVPGMNANGSRAYWPHSGKDPIADDNSQKCPGAYKLTTNYCGGTDFTLETSQDFLAPIKLVSPNKSVDLAQTIHLKWDPVPNALAYILTAFGGSETETVFWTSANDPDVTVSFVYEAIPQSKVKEYIEKGILLPPEKTDCRIPAGIFKDCQSTMLSVVAVGTDKLQTKDGIATHVTVRSTATAMLGMSGLGDMGAEDEVAEEPAESAEPAAPTEDKAAAKDSKEPDAVDNTDDAIDKAGKAKDTINRAKDILKW